MSKEMTKEGALATKEKAKEALIALVVMSVAVAVEGKVVEGEGVRAMEKLAECIAAKRLQTSFRREKGT